MGQKVNPHGLRVGVIKNWDSRWFADDKVFGMQPASRVPNFDTVPTDVYNRGYFVKIKHPLW